MTVRRLHAYWLVRTVWFTLSGSRWLVHVDWFEPPISALEPSAARKPSTGRIGVDVNRRSLSESAPSP